MQTRNYYAFKGASSAIFQGVPTFTIQSIPVKRAGDGHQWQQRNLVRPKPHRLQALQLLQHMSLGFAAAEKWRVISGTQKKRSVPRSISLWYFSSLIACKNRGIMNHEMNPLKSPLNQAGL